MTLADAYKGGDVFKPYSSIPVTEEMLRDVEAYREEWNRIANEVFERAKDLSTSPRLGPTRRDLNVILWDRHHAERGIRALKEVGGKPAGPLRR